MICKNCNKEIGQKTECAFCGYDPAKDGEGAVYVGNGEEYAVLPPVKIKLLEKSNDMAVAAFIFSFPLFKTALSKQRRLLISGNPCDRNFPAADVGVAEYLARAFYAR